MRQGEAPLLQAQALSLSHSLSLPPSLSLSLSLSPSLSARLAITTTSGRIVTHCLLGHTQNWMVEEFYFLLGTESGSFF